MDSVQLPQIGDHFLERWRIEEEVGRGGFSVVYRAVDAQERVAALKLLLPEEISEREHGYDADVAERFLREAHLLDQLESPYTINMWEFGESDRGLYYMVFEFIDGRSLFDEIRNHGAMEEDRVIHCLRQTLIGLQSAHELGILHRDIKPNNIMLFERDDDPDRVKLVDFGIAKMFGEARQEPGMDLTAAGFLVGTPRYMSPEQLRNGTLGPPSDLYSLGLCAFEMLTGKKCIPFKDRMQILRAQISAESFRLPPSVKASVGLTEIVHRLVDKHLERRYASAAEALRDLEELAGDPGATGDTVYQTISAELLEPLPAEADEETIVTTVNEAEWEEAIAHASTMAADVRGTPLQIQGPEERTVDVMPQSLIGASDVSRSGEIPIVHGSGQFEQHDPYGPASTPRPPSYNSDEYPQPASVGSGQFEQPPAIGGSRVPQASPAGSGQYQQPPAYGSGQYQQPPAYGSGMLQQPPPSTWDPAGTDLELDYDAMRAPPLRKPPAPESHHNPPQQQVRLSPQQMATQRGARGLAPDEKVALGASVFLPGLGHVLLDQTWKGFILVGLSIVGIGAVGLAFGLLAAALWVVLAAVAFIDMFLVIRARRRRPLKPFEFFPDLDQLL